MADDNLPEKPPGTDSEGNHRQLVEYLQERYNMPTEELSTFDKFEQLSKILGHTQTPQSTVSDFAQQETEAVAARLARAHALPAITVILTGTFALSLSATNEPLQCAAFGSMSSATYLDVFWESVVRNQSAEVNVAVREAHDGPVPRILLSFQGRLFQVKYFQCEGLVRNYPNVLEAPASFLEDGNSCGKLVQEALEYAKQCQALGGYVDANPAARIAYYYNRALAINRWNLASQDAADTIASWLEQDIVVPASRKLQRLKDLEAQPFPEKFIFQSYVKVSVHGKGPSKAKFGAWISMVERKLLKLKARLLFRSRTILESYESEVKLWPQRLVSAACEGDDGYEGCYVLGLRHDNAGVVAIAETSSDVRSKSAPLGTLSERLERWKQEIEQDELTEKTKASIDCSILLATELADFDLKPCTKAWPLPTIKAEEKYWSNLRDQVVHTRAKNVQKVVKNPQPSLESLTEDNNSSQKLARLRPAQDVLNRLLYDKSYDIDEFVVGYKDRHSDRLLEKAAVDWKKETTAEDFIPQHKIEYFKRTTPDWKSEILWDKKRRVDKMFMSG